MVRATTTGTTRPTPERSSGITYREAEPGLNVTYAGQGAATTGALTVGRYFVENLVQRHFAHRVAQVGHEIDEEKSIGPARGGMVGPSRSDEREFLAFYREGPVHGTRGHRADAAFHARTGHRRGAGLLLLLRRRAPADASDEAR